jgi:hypothetical protein
MQKKDLDVHRIVQSESYRETGSRAGSEVRIMYIHPDEELQNTLENLNKIEASVVQLLNTSQCVFIRGEL